MPEQETSSTPSVPVPLVMSSNPLPVLPNLPQPPPPPPSSAFEISTQNQISQIFEALHSLVESQSQLSSQVQALIDHSSSHSAAPSHSPLSHDESKFNPSLLHHSSVGVKRELTPHPSAIGSSSSPSSSPLNNNNNNNNNN